MSAPIPELPDSCRHWLWVIRSAPVLGLRLWNIGNVLILEIRLWDIGNALLGLWLWDIGMDRHPSTQKDGRDATPNDTE